MKLVPAISTRRQDSALRFYLKITEELATKTPTSDSVASFVDIAKTRCARLHVGYDTDAFKQAVRLTVLKHPRLVET